MTIPAFAALRGDGSVVVWGDYLHGGEMEGPDLAESLRGGVQEVVGNHSGFAALTQAGGVVYWGQEGPSHLPNPGLESGVAKIYATKTAFAALLEDESVVTWGCEGAGGPRSVRRVGLRIRCSNNW